MVTPEVLALPWQERYVQVWLRTFHFFAAHPHQTAYYEQYKNSAHADYDFDDVGNEHMMALIAAVQVDIAAGHVLASAVARDLHPDHRLGPQHGQVADQRGRRL
ncbi:MAG: hypothetical protein R2873_05360 [Caldilineaceae bacterium]